MSVLRSRLDCGRGYRVLATIKLYDPVQGWFARLPETGGYPQLGRFRYPSAS